MSILAQSASNDAGGALITLIAIGAGLWWLFKPSKSRTRYHRPSRPRRPRVRRNPDYYYENGDNRNLRRRLIRRQGGKCYYCAKPLPLYPPSGSWHESNWDYPTIDHVQPRSRGGSHHISNLVAACWGCNKRKGTRRVA